MFEAVINLKIAETLAATCQVASLAEAIETYIATRERSFAMRKSGLGTGCPSIGNVGT